MALQISVRERGDVTILDVAGELNASGCPALPQQVKQLLALGKRKIAINLEEVTFVDSTGLGSLVASFTSARSHNGALKLFSPNPVVHEAIQMTLLHRVIETHHREADALASFG